MNSTRNIVVNNGSDANANGDICGSAIESDKCSGGHVPHQLQTRDSRRVVIAVTADTTLQMINIMSTSMPDNTNVVLLLIFTCAL